MKFLKNSLNVIFILLIFNAAAFTQDCKVLLKDISESYTGDCKKGLAHGNGKAIGKDTYDGQFRKGYPQGLGTYTWADGQYYTGKWRQGQRNGEGTLYYKTEYGDTALAGIWDKDEYIGIKVEKPVVQYKVSVDSYSFDRVGDGNRYLISIMMNGVSNSSIEDLHIISTSGTQFAMGKYIGFETVTFPVICKVSYKTWNKLRTSKHDVIFEFEIKQEGNWKVTIVN